VLEESAERPCCARPLDGATVQLSRSEKKKPAADAAGSRRRGRIHHERIIEMAGEGRGGQPRRRPSESGADRRGFARQRKPVPSPLHSNHIHGLSICLFRVSTARRRRSSLPPLVNGSSISGGHPDRQSGFRRPRCGEEPVPKPLCRRQVLDAVVGLLKFVLHPIRHVGFRISVRHVGRLVWSLPPSPGPVEPASPPARSERDTPCSQGSGRPSHCYRETSHRFVSRWVPCGRSVEGLKSRWRASPLARKKKPPQPDAGASEGPRYAGYESIRTANRRGRRRQSAGRHAGGRPAVFPCAAPVRIVTASRDSASTCCSRTLSMKAP
jgi:hypothetical protein